jgi:hypothetical protein
MKGRDKKPDHEQAIHPSAIRKVKRLAFSLTASTDYLAASIKSTTILVQEEVVSPATKGNIFLNPTQTSDRRGHYLYPATNSLQAKTATSGDPLCLLKPFAIL